MKLNAEGESIARGEEHKGGPMSPEDGGHIEVVQARLKKARFMTAIRIGNEYDKRALGVNQLVTAGRVVRASEGDKKDLADYLVWMIVKSIEHDSRLPETQVRETASSAAERAARKWIKDHPSDFRFIDPFGKINYLLSSRTERLLIAATSAFVESLREQAGVPR